MDLGPLRVPAALLLAFASVPAAAAQPDGEASDSGPPTVAEPDGGAPDSVSPATTPSAADPRAGQPWLERWAPDSGQIEVGPYLGVLLTSPRIELFEADVTLPDQGYRPFASVAPDFGARAGYYPLRFFGVEAEGGAMPTRTATTDDAALLWTMRAHLVGQLGLWSVTPFVVAGAGLLGVASDRSSVGNDVDASGHFGAGVKVYLGRLTALRLDVRDVIAARRGYDAGVIHNPEILLGLSITFGRPREEVPPPPELTHR